MRVIVPGAAGFGCGVACFGRSAFTETRGRP
jgi:hypothetical protein